MKEAFLEVSEEIKYSYLIVASAHVKYAHTDIGYFGIDILVEYLTLVSY